MLNAILSVALSGLHR